MIIKLRDVEYFENSTTSKKDSQTSTLEDCREENSSKVVEKQHDLHKSKRIRKVKEIYLLFFKWKTILKLLRKL